MNQKDENEEIAFGMTSRQISEAAEALSNIKDDNHPKTSGSYENFIAVRKAGHEALLAQKDYGKID